MSKQIFFISIIILTAFFSGCFDFPEDVIMPQWDVDLNIPLTNKTYTLDEVIKTSDYVSIDTQQNYLYMVNSTIFEHKITVADFVQAIASSSNLDNTLTTNNQTKEIFLNFPDSSKIISATFIQGKIKVIAHNPNAAGSATLHIKAPGLKTISPPQKVLEFDMVIPANSSITEERDLVSYTYIQPVNQDPYSDGKLWIQAVGSSPIPNLGIISIDCISSDFIFSKVYGYLHPKSLGHKERTFALDWGTDVPNYRDKFKLKESKLVLSGDYLSTVTDPFSVRLKNVSIIGKRNNQIFSLVFNNGNIPLDFINKTVMREYNQDNSNINNFIEFMPDSVIVAADYFINDDNNTTYKTAINTDSVKFSAFFQAKNILAIKQCTTQDTVDLKITSDDRDLIVKGQAANVSFQIENCLPLDVWIKVVLADSNKKPLFTATSTMGNGKDTILIKAASIDNVGNIISPGVINKTITLSADQISKLSKSFYSFLSVTVQTAGYNETNPFKFPLRSTDWIKVKTFGSVKYRVKEDK